MLIEIYPVAIRNGRVIRAMIVLKSDSDVCDKLPIYDDDLNIHFWADGRIVHEVVKSETRTLNRRIDYVSFISRSWDDIIMSVYIVKNSVYAVNDYYFSFLPYSKYPEYIKRFFTKYEVYYKIYGLHVVYGE